MANKYCNLVGTNKIKDEYSKINTGFDKVETDVNAVNGRVDNIVNNPDPNKDLELVDLRNSNIYGVFPTAKARSDNTDNLVSLHASLIDNPTMHRNIFRGKKLGTSLTTEQKTNIQNGTFKGLFLGDYWVIGGQNWRIVDFDYWYRCGDTSFGKHHLVIMPDKPLYNSQMNDTNITEGGYVGSLMYTANLENAKTIINSAFGDAVLTHREYLTNAVTSGYPSGGAWFDSNVELPNEIMIYGSLIHTPAGNGSIIVNRYTISKQQLALFSVAPEFVNIRATYWLRDVISAANFAYVAGSGLADYYASASYSYGVRPVFPIG